MTTKAHRLKARTDWEAVERDFATGKYTDGELASLHHVARETISRRRKADQAKDARRWQRDLSKQVREATQALLLHKQATSGVTQIITDGHTATAILTAAEIGKQVILGHRSEIRETKEVVAGLLRELKGAALLAEHSETLAAIIAGDETEGAAKAQSAIARMLGLGSRVTSVKALADALTKLHAAERIAFDLEDNESTRETSPLAALISQMRGSSLPVVKLPPKDDE